MFLVTVFFIVVILLTSLSVLVAGAVHRHPDPIPVFQPFVAACPPMEGALSRALSIPVRQS
jgi:hypothetical protein